jgi:DNA-binding transcriptional ArsR family regulator
LAVPEDDQQGWASGRKPDVGHAIGNPVRRDILRALLDADRPLTVSELDELIPTTNANVSSLTYHVLVLQREECVAQEGEVVLSNGAVPAFVATVVGNTHVIGILESRREGDERR